MKIKFDLKVRIMLVIIIAGLFVVPASYALTRTITSSSDDVYTSIVCSNGNIYEATFANLQTAVNSSGCTEVSVPSCNISFNKTLWMPSGVWLHGTGNGTIFYLPDNVNRTMIKNGNPNGNINIRLSDFLIDGNNYHQTAWWRNNEARWSYVYGIYLKKTNHSSIDHVTIKNATCGAVMWNCSSNISVSFVNTYNSGALYIDHPKYNQWWAKGIFFDDCKYGTISNCISDSDWSGGIVVESISVSKNNLYTHDITVSNCIVSRTEVGFYTESARDITFIGCRAFHCNNNHTYNGGYGFLTASNTKRIQLSDCAASYCGNISDAAATATASNYIIQGDNSTLDNCFSSFSYGDGFRILGHNNTFSNCRSDYDADEGFLVDGADVCFFGCTVFKSVGKGIELTGYKYNNNGTIVSGCHFVETGQQSIHCYQDNTTISSCTIIGAGSTAITLEGNNNKVSMCIITDAVGYGIYIYGDAENCSILGNTIELCAAGTGIAITTSRNNTVALNHINHCTIGISEGVNCNWNMVNHNNALSCTTPFDLTGAKTIAFAGTTNFGTVS